MILRLLNLVLSGASGRPRRCEAGARCRFACRALAGVLLVAVVAGCGDDSSGSGQAAGGVTVTITSAAPTSPPVPTPAPPKVAPPAPAPRAAVAAPRSAAGKISVPDVVGNNHQLAQDTMQARGLYNLAEEDATGQGRLLLFDRNWVVVAQQPAAGSRVDENAVIVLRSKKYGE